MVERQSQILAEPATALAEPLLAVAPCLDDLVVLHGALPLPRLFLRQLQRLTCPGKLTCLAGRRARALLTCAHKTGQIIVYYMKGKNNEEGEIPIAAYQVDRAKFTNVTTFGTITQSWHITP